MADSKVADLTEDTAPALDDWLYKVNNAGTLDRKSKVANLNARRGCRVYKSTTTTISNGTLTALSSFNTERWDTDAYHDTGTNPGRISIPSGHDGLFAAGAHTEWDANSTGVRTIYIRKNGTDYLAGLRYNASGSSNTTGLSVVTMAPLVATDYLEVVVYQDSGGDLDLQPGGASANQYKQDFWVQRIGA